MNKEHPNNEGVSILLRRTRKLVQNTPGLKPPREPYFSKSDKGDTGLRFKVTAKCNFFYIF